MTGLILLQLALVLGMCRVLGQVLQRLRQPAVVCQMLAGILIGPLLLGTAPWWRQLIFPPSSPLVIAALGQVGLVLFMFCVGAELELPVLRRQARSIVSISGLGIVVPFSAGAVAAVLLMQDGNLFPRSANGLLEIAFLGTTFAVTAFPVMARIIHELGIMETGAGVTALSSGSVTDGLAWCLLAFLLAGMGGSWQGATMTVATMLVLTVLVLLARANPVKRLLRAGLAEWHVATWQTPAVLVVLLLVAWLSDVTGLHPAFGAFLFGLTMPRGALNEAVRRQMEPVVFNVLLPLYFVSTGLSISMGMLADWRLLAVGLLLLLSAVLSKGISCWLAARLSGHSTGDSLVVAALMNARGLVELVVLNIGLQHGVITPALFSIMVVVAVLTTMMPGPTIGLIWGYPGRERGQRSHPERHTTIWAQRSVGAALDRGCSAGGGEVPTLDDKDGRNPDPIKDSANDPHLDPVKPRT